MKPTTKSNFWTILHTDENDSKRFVCLCDCGEKKSVLKRNIKNQTSKSCGCIKKLFKKEKKTKDFSEYWSWIDMKSRCRDKDSEYNKIYRKKNINVCKRWRDSFEAFCEDMGPKPSPLHSIDRKDNNGDYCPDNCRWATQKQQGRNKDNNNRLSFYGITATIAEWVEITGIKFTCIKKRLFLGWTIEKTLSSPVRTDPKNNPHQRIKDFAAKNSS